MTLNGTSANGTVANSEKALELCLPISDAELLTELHAYPEGEERSEFAISAMKIGAIALRQAQGRIDADTVRHEGERFIQSMGHALEKHQTEVTRQISDCITKYFHPDNGRFNERVKRLVDGDNAEIARVIRGQISGDGSELARTLTAHVGAESPLMHKLDPNAKDGLINALAESIGNTLKEQRELILRELSPNNDEGALSQTVSQLTKKHGEVSEALKNQINELVGQLSMDNEGSALKRIRHEIKGVLDAQSKENREFQAEVREKLTEMTARRQEAAKSTRHGLVFEEAVFDFIKERSQKAEDVAIPTGNTVGNIPRSKKGDAVIELGPEHVAAGARIVVEAKADASYSIDRARAELEEAKKNRDAGVGLFVFSSTSAPTGIDAFRRYGSDLVVIWNEEDAASDAYLDAGISVAKALCVQSKSRSDEVGADMEAINKAVRAIEKEAKGLDEIKTLTTTIKNNSEKILTRAEIMKESFRKQIDVLDEKIGSLR